MTPYRDILDSAQELTAWRREFHRIPELGMDVPETAALVVSHLEDCGVDQVLDGVAGHGVVGLVENGDGPVVALRADMDALPIHEAGDVPYASTRPGVMHACGHDGHMTMLLGAARRLARERQFRGRAVLLFQPGEETLEGARAMIADGILERFGVDTIYGLHNLPGGPPGSFRIPDGPVMASSNRFQVTITGRGGHAALPELCRNPIDVAAAIVGWLETFDAGGEEDRVVLTVTNVAAGTGVYNVVPDDARLQGSLRFLDADLAEPVETELRSVVDAVAAQHRVSVDLLFEPLCPVTANTAAKAAFARSVAQDVGGAGGAGVTEGEPLMASEDFAFFLQARPGAFALIGNGATASLHHAEYDFNDEILPVGASYLAGLVEAGGGVA